MPQSLGGCGLLSVQDTISIDMTAIASYLSSVEEPLLMAVQDYGWFPNADGKEPSVSKSSLQTNPINLWKSKPLHGQFMRNVQEEMDTTLQWSWLTSCSLMPKQRFSIYLSPSPVVFVADIMIPLTIL